MMKALMSRIAFRATSLDESLAKSYFMRLISIFEKTSIVKPVLVRSIRFVLDRSRFRCKAKMQSARVGAQAGVRTPILPTILDI